MIPGANELVNRFRRAAGIATAMQQFCKRQRIEVAEYIGTLTSREWEMFATLSGARVGYSPSEDTRTLVREIIRDRAAKLCIDCGARVATLQATPSGREGDELCDSCHALEFDDLHADDGAEA